MNFQQLLTGLSTLGQSMQKWEDENDSVIYQAYLHNNWFTEEFVKLSLHSWSDLLTIENLQKWMASYHSKHSSVKTFAIVMAGNIPLVGFHDLLSVLITENKALVKLSSDDSVLMKKVISELIAINPDFGQLIEITDGMLTTKGYDGVIATGSNNTNRYFEYYFKNKPHILRKNRNSIALLTGGESEEELSLLADDIFMYFGLGCRNVSQILVPEGYDFHKFFQSMEKYAHLIQHNKYANNYTYHKSILLMNRTAHLDNGFILLLPNDKVASPLSIIHYAYYNSEADWRKLIESNAPDVQCVIGKYDGLIDFGKAQFPQLNDYADGVDTINFIINSVS